MKKSLFVLSLAVALCAPFNSQARDTTHYLDFQSVVRDATADRQLDGTVKFYLKGQRIPGKVKRAFPEAVSNKKTNSSNKSDEAACERALRSVLISFQDNAKRHGANAVIDLESYYQKRVYSSKTQYECHAGNWMSGVTMKGRAAIVK